MTPTRYRTVDLSGLDVFYREAGPSGAPAVLLLHGFPSSSRMWQPLIDQLADRYRMVAPDYPGFGHSDAPPANSFRYTFDHLAEIIEQFTDEIGLTRYSLAVQDYGGPVGMRLALRRPERLSALIVQNAVCHEDGLGPLWETRRAFWSDRARHEEALRENFLTPTATTPICGTTNLRSSTNPANRTSRPTCFTTTAPTWRVIRCGSSGYAT